jgi:hypothetical protein
MAIDLEKLEDSPHLLDLLIQMEDVLDSLDTYVFRNWFDGEIVEGPKVRRYWLDMTLLFPKKKMPDPRAGLRLLKHGIRVDFQEGQQETSGEVRELSGVEGKANKDGNHDVWLVRISIPRRLIAEIKAGELDFYDDELDDVEDVEDAQDSGMNDESGVVDPDQEGMDPNSMPPDGMDDGMGMDPMGGPPQEAPRNA